MSYKYFGRLVGKVSTGEKALTESAPANTLTPFDPQQPATKFMAYGEDATSLAFNRALAALATNIESISSVLNAITLKSAVISPMQLWNDDDFMSGGWTGEILWMRGSVVLSDNHDVGDQADMMNAALTTSDDLVRTGKTDLHLSGGTNASGRVPAQWVYVGQTPNELQRHVKFHRVEGQYGGGVPGGGGAVHPEGATDLSVVANPNETGGLQPIQDTHHTVCPSDVFENDTEYNSGTGYSYHQPKYKNQEQRFLTSQAASGIPLYIPPVKRIKTDLPPYSGNERYARIAEWDTDGLYIKDYSFDELYLKPGCFVEITGDGAEGAQAGNNGLFQIAEIVPADAKPPTGTGSKVILTRGGLHKVTVRDYMQFMEGEFVSWRTAPYHQDSGDPTDPESTALNPALRSNFAHIAFVVPRPDLLRDDRPDERPGDLYLSASTDTTRFVTKNYDGADGSYDWSRGVAHASGGVTTYNRYGGQRSRNSVGLPDKEDGAEQNWGLLPGTFLFHGHAHIWPEDHSAGEWGMAAAIGDIKFGSDVLGPDDGVHNGVVAAGEPVLFSLETAPGLIYGCAPSGFILNPVLTFQDGKSFYSGSYQAHIKTLSTVRENLLSAIKPDFFTEGLNLDAGLDFADAMKLRGWQSFLRTGTDAEIDKQTTVELPLGVGPGIPHPRNDGLNTTDSPTAQILGSSLWELYVECTVAGKPTLTEAWEDSTWGCWGDWVRFEHPDSNVGTHKFRRYAGKIISAVADPNNDQCGTIIVGSVHAEPEDDGPEHDHLTLVGPGGYPFQATDQNGTHGDAAGGSTFYTDGGDTWQVKYITKAPVVTNSEGVSFVPSHGLNAAYHNNFSANENMRYSGLVSPVDGRAVQSATGNTIYENPMRPFTLVLPNWQDWERFIWLRSDADHVTLVRLDSKHHDYDDVWSTNTEREQGARVRIGYGRLNAIAPRKQVDDDGDSEIDTIKSQDDSLTWASSTGYHYNVFGLDNWYAWAHGTVFGSETITATPPWYDEDIGWNVYDSEGVTLEVGGIDPDLVRRDIPLEGMVSAAARDDGGDKNPSLKQAAFDHSTTPQESQDRSILGSIEATVLGNYNHDLVNEATRKLYGHETVTIGEAYMKTEHQFGVLSNGVITGGYCFSLVNENAGEIFPSDTLFDRLSYHDFGDWTADDADGAKRGLVFCEAYVLLGGAKWHIPADVYNLEDYSDDLDSREFMVWFDARARKVLIKPIGSAADMHSSPAAADPWLWSQYDEAHIVPFAKVVTDNDGFIEAVINLRKPISRVDERTNLLVGTTSTEELASHMKLVDSAPGEGHSQFGVDAHTQAQLHFKNVGEALVYIEHMDNTQAYKGRKWTIEVVGSCHEFDHEARGITLPMRFPVHGINLIGHKGADQSWLHNREMRTAYTHPTEPASAEGVWMSWWHGAATPTDDAVNDDGWLRIHPGHGPVIYWSEGKPLFDLNSRQGVTVRDVNLRFIGVDHGLDEEAFAGNYWDTGWDTGVEDGHNTRPNVAAFICTRKDGDLSIPAMDQDRGGMWTAIYGLQRPNAAFSGNYLFEGVTLHNGGILCDFYNPTTYTRTTASLDNITLRNCRAINVTHGLAAFGCTIWADDGDVGEMVNWDNVTPYGAAFSYGAGNHKKYHKGITIDSCEAVCVPSEHGHMHEMWEEDHTAFSKRRAGVFATHSKEVTVTNCSFHGGFAYGVYFGEDVQWYDFGGSAESQHWATGTIENNTISGPLEVGIFACSQHEFSDIRIVNNTIRDPGMPYWKKENYSTQYACEDPWGIVVDGANFQVTGNTIRHTVYALDAYGGDGLDKSQSNFCGGIYFTGAQAFYYKALPSEISGNSIHLVGKALKGIVLADAVMTDFWEYVASHTHGIHINGNNIINDITTGYSWSTGYYSYENNEGGVDDVFDAADARFELMGTNYPFSIFVGWGHQTVKIVDNNLVGPVYFGIGTNNSIFSNNTLRDCAASPSGYLPESNGVMNTNDKGNAAMLVAYDTQNISITNNQMHMGHVFLDSCMNAKVDGNNLYPHGDRYVIDPVNQPVGIFLREDCHQANIINNHIPGDGFIFVGAGGDCFDCSIRGNKWGVRAETQSNYAYYGGFYTADIDHNQGYLGEIDLWDYDLDGDDIHNGGLVYWDGGGGLIADNVLLNNDIFVGNYNWDLGDWYGSGQVALAEGDTIIAEKRAGANFTVSRNKLNGGSIHMYSWGGSIVDNDLRRYSPGDGRPLQQALDLWLFVGTFYQPNIESYGRATRISGNACPGTIYSAWNDNGIISENSVGRDIVTYSGKSLQIINNNLSVIEPQMLSLDTVSGKVRYNPTDDPARHIHGQGNIVLQSSDNAVVSGNVSLMGYEEISARPKYLLGVRTDPNDHLYYADYVAPFRNWELYGPESGYQVDFDHGVYVMQYIDAGGDTEGNVTAHQDTRAFAEAGNSNHVGGPGHNYWCQQPEPGESGFPAEDHSKHRIGLVYSNSGGLYSCSGGTNNVGPFSPLNWQSRRRSDDGFPSMEIMLGSTDSYTTWGRRIYAYDSFGVDINNNKVAHIEVDNCSKGSVTRNRCFWGGFNPNYTLKNHSILLHGDVTEFVVSDNKCSGSIWIADNYNWGDVSSGPDGDDTVYNWGSVQVSLMVNGNTCGWHTDRTSFCSSQINLSNDTTPEEEQWATSKYLFGGGGNILIDNCTMVTANHNVLNAARGPYPDRWWDNTMDGVEWGEIYLNRLGNPFAQIISTSDDGSSHMQAHKQNYGTVVTFNQAAGVMGWVRQPDHHTENFTNDTDDFFDNGEYKGPYASGNSLRYLSDRVIPCIGGSFGDWTGNRLTDDIFTVMTELWTEGGSFAGFTIEDFTHPYWGLKDWVGSNTHWWGNMDSTTGPFQANGEHGNASIPSCTGSKYFGNPTLNYWDKD